MLKSYNCDSNKKTFKSKHKSCYWESELHPHPGRGFSRTWCFSFYSQQNSPSGLSLFSSSPPVLSFSWCRDIQLLLVTFFYIFLSPMKPSSIVICTTSFFSFNPSRVDLGPTMVKINNKYWAHLFSNFFGCASPFLFSFFFKPTFSLRCTCTE